MVIVSLLNIYHLRVTNFFVMRTSKIYSFSNLQIYNTVLTTVTMLYITYPRLIYFYNWKFVPLTSFIPLTHHPIHL